MLTDFVQGNSNTYTKNPNYWDKEKIAGAAYKLPVRRQDRLSHHQGRGDLHHRAAHRQARHSREHPLAARRAAEEERAARCNGRSGSTCRGTFLVDARRHQAVRRRPRAPRPQHGGQQAGDRLGLLRRQCRAVRLSAASRLSRLFRAAGADADVGQGAVHLQSGQGEAAAGRGRLPEGLQLQGPGLLMQSRPHGAAAAGRRLSRAGRRQDGDPADGIRRVPVRDDDEDASARLLHEQRSHQPDHHACARASRPGRPGIRRCGPIPSSTHDRRDVPHARRGEAHRA